MANTYTWVISSLDCYPQQDNHEDVVFTVHWRRQATDGTHVAEIYSAQSLTIDASENFTPYADLTFDQVCGWLDEAMGPEQVAAMDAALDQQIANQINPPIISPPLPWSA